LRDNAGENKSQEIQEFFKSGGVLNHFSTPEEQWQNGAAESTINSIMLIARTSWKSLDWVVDFGSRRLLLALMHGMRHSRHTLRHHLIRHCSEHQRKDVSGFRAFKCKAVVYLN
jgi:hypothetical protein